MNKPLPPDIIEQIYTAFQQVSAQFPEGAVDSKWTFAVKMEIGMLGERLGYEICAGGMPRRENWCSEWLFDLAWYLGDGQMQSLPLIMESEWVRDDESLRVDFEKLLIAKSQIKIFVFQTKSVTRRDQVIARCISGVKKFGSFCSDEKYIFACLDEYDLNFTLFYCDGEALELKACKTEA